MSELEQALARQQELISAIRDIDQHATPYGIAEVEDPDGNPAAYIVTVGALHRALGAAAGQATVGGDHHAAIIAERDALKVENHLLRSSAGKLHLEWLRQMDELNAQRRAVLDLCDSRAAGDKAFLVVAEVRRALEAS